MGRFGLAGAVKRDGRARGAIKQIHCLYYTHVPQITSELEHESAQDEDEQETSDNLVAGGCGAFKGFP